MTYLRRVLNKMGLLPYARLVRGKVTQLRLPETTTIDIAGTTTAFHIGTDMEFKHFTEKEVVSERAVIDTLVEHLHAGDVFWDIGGGMGMHTCIVGNAVPEATVVAFEPHPGRHLRILENADVNDLENVYCYNLAVSDSFSRLELLINYSDPNVGRLLEGAETETASKQQRGDTLVDAGVPAPTVVKIDVDGFEHLVLEGLSELLDDIEFIIVEIHPNLLDVPPEAVEQRLVDTGFSLDNIGDRGDQYHVLASRSE